MAVPEIKKLHYVFVLAMQIYSSTCHRLVWPSYYAVLLRDTVTPVVSRQQIHCMIFFHDRATLQRRQGDKSLCKSCIERLYSWFLRPHLSQMLTSTYCVFGKRNLFRRQRSEYANAVTEPFSWRWQRCDWLWALRSREQWYVPQNLSSVLKCPSWPVFHV